MNATIVKVTYDRKTKIKISEEVVKGKPISDNFYRQVCNVLIKGLIDEKIVCKRDNLEDVKVVSNAA